MSLFEDDSLTKLQSEPTEILYEGCLTLLEGLPGPSVGAYPYRRKYSLDEDMDLFHKTKPAYDLIRLYVFELLRRNVLRTEDLEENYDVNHTQEDCPNRSIVLEKDASCSKCFEPFRLGEPIVLVPTKCRMFAHAKIKSFMMCEPCSVPYGPYHPNDQFVVTEDFIRVLERMNYDLMWRDSKEILVPLFRVKYRHLMYLKRTMIKQGKELLE